MLSKVMLWMLVSSPSQRRPQRSSLLPGHHIPLLCSRRNEPMRIDKRKAMAIAATAEGSVSFNSNQVANAMVATRGLEVN